MESSYRHPAISRQLHPFFTSLLLILWETIGNERVKHFLILLFDIWEIFSNGFAKIWFSIFLVQIAIFCRLRELVLIFRNILVVFYAVDVSLVRWFVCGNCNGICDVYVASTGFSCDGVDNRPDFFFCWAMRRALVVTTVAVSACMYLARSSQ